jgi:uncharacterized protein (TIGR02246 family)
MTLPSTPETSQADPKSVVTAYLDALREHNLERCMALYADDAVIEIMHNQHRGRQAIEEWHRERFAVELQLTKVDAVKAKGQTVVVDAAISTKRLRAWKIPAMSGRATFQLQDGMITELKLAGRGFNPFEGWGG